MSQEARTTKTPRSSHYYRYFLDCSTACVVFVHYGIGFSSTLFCFENFFPRQYHPTKQPQCLFHKRNKKQAHTRREVHVWQACQTCCGPEKETLSTKHRHMLPWSLRLSWSTGTEGGKRWTRTKGKQRKKWKQGRPRYHGTAKMAGRMHKMAANFEAPSQSG